MNDFFEISAHDYFFFAERFVSLADGDEYFSGTISHSTPRADIELSASVFIYRDYSFDSEVYGAITSIVPVWWECRVTTDEGEQLNDFDFGTFRTAVLSL